MRSAVTFLRRLSRKVWFRAAVFTVVAIGFALAAGFLGPLIPFRVVIDLGQDSVGTILQIIASSMLTVTTFSLTAMVTVYSAATTTATPRATQLMVEDPTSQNALSTFVGAFAFSLVGIIALSTGYYTEQGRTILFFGTLLVIAIIVITLLRWIAHLAAFGRLADVIDRVERAATESLRAYAEHPTLGAQRMLTAPAGTGVFAVQPGYVTSIDLPSLQRVAEDHDLRIAVTSQVGTTTDAAQPLVVVVGVVDDDVRAAVRRSFRGGAHRDYEQDPRLGVIALAEIGSRALSAATNDPGTAIEVIGALQRVLTVALETTPDPEVRFDRVAVPPVTLRQLLDDAVLPLSRDGAGEVEVVVRLQHALRGLAATAPEHASEIRSIADAAARRALGAVDRPDARRLREVRRSLWA